MSVKTERYINPGSVASAQIQLTVGYKNTQGKLVSFGLAHIFSV